MLKIAVLQSESAALQMLHKSIVLEGFAGSAQAVEASGSTRLAKLNPVKTMRIKRRARLPPLPPLLQSTCYML